jgi:predicted dehydrogenase
VKALVVGLGSAGRRHARNWAALGLGELLICRQTDTPQPEPLGVEARLFTDLSQALAEKPDVTIVTNPTSLHVATARAAVAEGAHVLVEKPVGHSADGVAALLQEADEQGVKVAAGYTLRFHPGLQRLRELLFRGAIGKALTAHAEMGEYLPGWHPWEDYRASYSARRELGGGPILTFSHELDSICWLFGAPTAVTCRARNVSSLAIDTEDTADLILEYPGGPAVTVHVDYLRQPPRRFLEVVGGEGVLRWEYDENRLLVYSAATRQWRTELGDPSFERNDMFLNELRTFVDWTQGAQRPETLADGQQGAGILLIALAALRSAEQNHTVDLTRPETGDFTAWLTSLGPRP